MPGSSFQVAGVTPTKIVTYVTSVAVCRGHQRQRLAVAVVAGGASPWWGQGAAKR